MTPAAVLLDQLAEARRRGVVFEDAWRDAVAEALDLAPDRWERKQWAVVFEETMPSWRAGFERQPAVETEVAFAMLEDDRVPVPA